MALAALPAGGQLKAANQAGLCFTQAGGLRGEGFLAVYRLLCSLICLPKAASMGC